MHDSRVDDVRAADPVDRLLEDSWESRQERVSTRELRVEAAAAALFLCAAVPLAIPPLTSASINLPLVGMLVALYALVASAVRFPIGAGYVVPSYLILVPMLMLLPPGLVPLLVAGALGSAGLVQWLGRRASLERALFAVPNAWHTVGPALVLILARRPHGWIAEALVYLAAFVAACGFDLVASTLREAFALAVAPQLQLRVVRIVWLLDACVVPLGYVLARGARHSHAELLLVLPLSTLLWVLVRDRNNRIAQAHHRLEIVRRERSRLQTAVGRLGDAFAARLELPALIGIVLRSCVEAVDADAGRFALSVPGFPPLVDVAGDAGLLPPADGVGAGPGVIQAEAGDAWTVTLPIGAGDGHADAGAVTLIRGGREFAGDELALLTGLVDRAGAAIRDILGHEALREQAVTDPLTGLGNRRKLSADLQQRLSDRAQPQGSFVLMLLDLDGFKGYNDTFGHLAGDELLARLGTKLASAAGAGAAAYRLGGDEFCVLLPARDRDLEELMGRAEGALCEVGEGWSIRASYGAVLVPHEASTADYALQLADQRMYGHKDRRPSAVREQTRDVLLRIMQTKQPDLPGHATGVARLAVRVGRRLGLDAEQVDELGRAAELHDIGKVAIPDVILDKAGELDAGEWSFVHQHTILGERILSAAPALRPVAAIVRSSHERWDGTGYPDRLQGAAIPAAARIIAVCDAYDAIVTARCYRPARTPAAALDELRREAGSQFDPAVVAAFMAELELDRSAPAGAAADDGAADETGAIAERFQALLAAG